MLSGLFFSCSSNSNFEENIISDMNPTPPVDSTIQATALYFPPINSNLWDTISPSTLGWNTNMEQPLYDFLETNNTEAFILLKDGKIVIEHYFGESAINSANPWYSAGKTLTALAVGIAQQEGFLSIDDASSDYLGTGWSNTDETIESQITVLNHLTMTTGLDYTVSNTNCTNPECLTFLNPSGSFWYYHNATYTLAQDIVANAIARDFESYFEEKIKNRIGMNGVWLSLGFANVYYSDARSMARFGLLNLNEGVWEQTPILADASYFNAMITTSQPMNEAYGYLWWLNGKASFRVPGATASFSGKLIPTAPDDLIAALGKDDQKLYIIPSKGIVVVRMGNSVGEELLGPSSFDTLLWEHISAFIN